MGYSSSPRPSFSVPTHITYEEATRHLWGDKVAGEVSDWIYVSSEQIHQLVFGLAPGGLFLHSDSFRTIFAADEVLHVLSGSMLICNPETGEVHPVRAGESAFFRRDTWHHVFNDSTEALRVLEYFAPPPSQGTSGSYAQTKPNLDTSSYTQDRWMGEWPMAREEAKASATIQVLREEDVLWRLEGDSNLAKTGILAATEQLTVGKIRLLPGQRTDVQVHGGDESLYVTEGNPNVFVPEAEGQRWFELKPGDGFYVPEGSPHQYYNMTGSPIEFMFGVAPGYAPVAVE